MPDSDGDTRQRSGSSSIKDNSAEGKANRKRYTITKPRELWSTEEHDKFLEAIDLYERDWRQIASFIPTKSVIQIRSHAQKYFLKMKKLGNLECIPPPRPKKRSKRPYPKGQTSDNSNDDTPMAYPKPRTTPADVIKKPEPGDPSSSSSNYMDGNFYPPNDTSRKPSIMQWQLVERDQLLGLNQGQLDRAQHYLQEAINGYSSNQVQQMQPKNQIMSGGKKPIHRQPLPAPVATRPEVQFSKIYKFLGGLFDPNKSGHVSELEELSELDRDVVKILMNNLANNLMGDGTNPPEKPPESSAGAPPPLFASFKDKKRDVEYESNGVILEHINSATSSSFLPVVNAPYVDVSDESELISFNGETPSPSTLHMYKMSPRVISSAMTLGSMASSSLAVDKNPPDLPNLKPLQFVPPKTKATRK